jgi:hypothetical protein
MTMKTFLIMLCLLPSMFINAQVIDWNNFDEGTMNDVMFIVLNDHTLSQGKYTLTISTEQNADVYKCLRKHNEKLSLSDLGVKVNSITSDKSAGVIDTISRSTAVKPNMTYQDVARRCLSDWNSNPSDAFFLIGYGKTVEVITLYNKKTETVYVSVIFVK